MGDIPTTSSNPSHEDLRRNLRNKAESLKRLCWSFAATRYGIDIINKTPAEVATALREAKLVGPVSPSDPQRLMNEGVNEVVRAIDAIESQADAALIKAEMGNVDLAAGRMKIVALQAVCYGLVFNPDGTDKVTRWTITNGLATQTRTQLGEVELVDFKADLATVIEALD